MSDYKISPPIKNLLADLRLRLYHLREKAELLHQEGFEQISEVLGKLEAETAADVFAATRDRHGSAEPLGHCKVAINDAMADWDSPIADGDTLLLFPPVAGG